MTAPQCAAPSPSRRFIEHALNAWEIALGSPIELIVKHFERRIMELGMACIELGEGILLIFSPLSMSASAFQFLTFWFDANGIMLTYLLLGLARIVALVLNGHWMPYGAYVRIGGCLVGAASWFWMGVALWYFDRSSGRPTSPGIPVYAVLMLFEFISCYRAVHGLKWWRAHGKSY